MNCRNTWTTPARTALGWFKAGLLGAAFALFGVNTQAQTIWDFGSLAFSNTNGVGTDVITANTSLTRAMIMPIYNSACEASSQQSCSWNPCNTEWAYGTIASWNSLVYGNLFNVNGCNPPSMVGQSMVCHLITENIYLQINWTQWTPGSGGTIAYTRTTMPNVPCSTGEAGTITPATASGCAGATYAMTSAGAETAAGLTYQWEVSTTGGGVGFANVVGGTGANTTSYTTGALSVGTYYYRLRVDCSNGPVTDYSNELTLTVAPTPTASASNNGPVCTGLNLAFTGTTDSGTSFQWTGPNGFSSTDQNPTIVGATTAASGTYNFTAILGGCTSPAATTVATVNAAPTLTAPAAASPNPICPGGNSQLSASATVPGYFLSTITFAPVSTAGGGTLFLSDDQVSGGVPIGFNFTFYGNTYTTLYVSSNGFVSFDPSVSQGCCSGGILPTNDLVNNVIAAAWDDLYPPGGGSITYLTSGAPGSRTMAISFTNLDYCCSGGTPMVTTQIIIYETTNVVEIHNTNINNISPGTQGIENAGGTEAVAVPGRNSTTWSATNDAYRFTPGAADYLWTPNTFLNFDNIANPLASNVTATTAYTVTMTNSLGCSIVSTTTVTVPTVDDGDPCTLDACLNGVATNTFQDADGDGLCDANDPCPNLANLANGDPCDDANACTINDVVAGCACAGTFQDTDGDGTCDANDGCVNDPNKTAPGTCGCGNPEPGALCDDGNPLTVGDVITAACICEGSATDCLGVPLGPDVPGAPCNDNDACTINDLWNASCVCTGTFEDTDGDLTCDANDGCPTDANKIAPGVCGCGVPDTDTDGDGLANCVDSCPALANLAPGESCSDADPCTINDVVDANCVCAGTPAPVTAGVTANQPSYCTPGPGVILTASGGISYSWAPAAGLSATTGSPVTATPASATTYTVTADNAAGCTGTATVTVGTGTTPGAPTASATPSTVCPGGDALMNVQGQVPTLVVTIQGSGFTDEVGWSLTNAVPAVVGSGGPYGGSGTYPTTIAVPGPSPFVLFVETQGSFNDNAVTYTVTCGGSTILTGFLGGGQTFTSAPVACSSSYTYSWSPATYLTSTTISNPTADNVAATTTYTATSTTAAGCSSSTTVTVTVDPGAVPVITGPTADPNPACPGGDSQLSVGTGGGSFTYCVPPLSFGCAFPDQISNVNVAGIVRASGCDNLSGANGYSLFASPQGALVAGSINNPYSVTTSGDVEGATIWIDYNQNGVFGAGEQLFNNYAGTNPATYSGTFNVPANAINGPTRLRVRCTYAGAPGTNPCGGTQTTYGETEDYTVIISGGTSLFTFSWSPATYLSSTTIQNPVAENVATTETYTVSVTNAAGCTTTGSVTMTLETTDTDGDLTVDCADGCPLDANKIAPGQCGCGVADTDTDGDLTADCNDLCPADPNKIDPGICGCGVSDVDTDGDLTADCNDLCPLDPDKIVPGDCGCGVADTDSDGDAIADCNDLCPTVPGTVGTPCNDGDVNTINDAIDATCTCTGTIPNCALNTVLLDLVTDDDGAQTSWDVVNIATTTAVCSGSGYLSNQTITLDCCLPNGCYELRVFDSAGDGMANGTVGGYLLRSAGAGNKRIIDNSGDGIFTSTSTIANNLGFCVPIGTDVVVAAHCDKTDWLPNDVIQATANPLVTAQFGVTNATSGYQFWFFNPDGGYSRRITQTHAAPGPVVGPPANVRSSYLRLSAMVTQPLPFYTNLNVRVRTQVAGVFSQFGPACRFRLDPPCATTQLTSIPNPVVSCNATGLTLTSTIYADAVAGASTYQFEFSKPGYLRRIATTVRSVALSFVTTPLQNNNCYNVRVRVSFDSGNSYCPFGNYCNITIGTAFCSPPGMALEPGSDGASVDEVRMAVWPNPNDGSLVNVSLTEFDATVNTVLVDVTDVYGKLVATRTIAVQDGYMNTTLSFEKDLAPGLYLVNLQVGEERHTERLVIQR